MSADDTIDALDALWTLARAKRASAQATLARSVGDLDGIIEEAPELSEARAAPVARPPRGRERPHLLPADYLPKRTTHGGPYGPAVREKFRRIALGE